MKFLKYIQEKLQPSQFRYFVKAWKNSDISKRYDSVFGKKDRIYIEYKGKAPEVKGEIEKEIEKIIAMAGAHEYEMKSYKTGIMFNRETKREIKIIKVLDSIIKKYHEKIGWANKEHTASAITKVLQNRIKSIEEIKKKFINDKERSLKKKAEYLICISRHAYDLAGMSTDRGWTSCQNIEGYDDWWDKNDLNHYVVKDIKAGTLIAYFIKADDKNLQHPIGRVLLKPYYNDDKDVILVAPTKYYGTAPYDFVETVQDWADKNFNKNKYGFFNRDETVYPEGKSVVRKIEPGKEVDLKIISSKDLVNFWKKYSSNNKYLSLLWEATIDGMDSDKETGYTLTYNRNITITEEDVVDMFNYTTNQKTLWIFTDTISRIKMNDFAESCLKFLKWIKSEDSQKVRRSSSITANEVVDLYIRMMDVKSPKNYLPVYEDLWEIWKRKWK